MKVDELRLRILSKVKHCQTNRNYYVWWGNVLYTADTPNELVSKIVVKGVGDNQKWSGGHQRKY